jgi:sec-independent protein translocase protein TatB
MFDIGWTELLVIGVVALIVIGPKELPEMFRTLGRFTAKARSMSRDFQRAMDAAARETGVNEVASDLRKVASPASMGLDAVKQAADKFEKWDPLKPAPKPAPVLPETMGPATKALAEETAARRAALAAGPVAEPDPAAPLVAPKPALAATAPVEAKPEAAPPAAAASVAAPQRKAVTRKPRATAAAPAAAPAPARPAPAKPAKTAAQAVAKPAKSAPKTETAPPAAKPKATRAKAKDNGPARLAAAVDKSTAEKTRRKARKDTGEA